jgi:DNA-binding NarL/FixJ family response regulator
MRIVHPQSPVRSTVVTRLHSPDRRGGGERPVALVVVGGARLLRAAVCGLIDAQHGMRVVGSLPSVEALADAYRRDPLVCDVVVLDADDAGDRCVAAVDRVLALGMRSRVVLLCSSVTEDVVLCVATRSIDGVVLKESSVSELREAVEEVISGRLVLPEPWAAEPRAVPLTPRQLEVLKLIAHGHSNEEIAGRLGLQRNTVKFHISQIFRRLGVRNRIEAVAQLVPDDRR